MKVINNKSYIDKNGSVVVEHSYSFISTRERIGAVYMLYNEDGALIYIGQTQNLRLRLNEHCKNENKDWNYAYIIPISHREHRLFVESIFIKNLKPLNNKSCGSTELQKYKYTYLHDLQRNLNEANKQIDFILNGY